MDTIVYMRCRLHASLFPRDDGGVYGKEDGWQWAGWAHEAWLYFFQMAAIIELQFKKYVLELASIAYGIYDRSSINIAFMMFTFHRFYIGIISSGR